LKIFPRFFYERDPEVVARELLGKKLVRRMEGNRLVGLIVETEAYYGLKDPASRAYHGLKKYNRWMWETPGTVFIYNVHNNWLLNIIAHEPEEIGGVLIRSIEPCTGIEIMKAHRGMNDLHLLTRGPGRLTKALKIDKRLNGTFVTSLENGVVVVDHPLKVTIGSSHRIGVRRDLDKKLRFFIKGNRFVSR
jgi:DNA-3-methyladenine glycosylase